MNYQYRCLDVQIVVFLTSVSGVAEGIISFVDDLTMILFISVWFCRLPPIREQGELVEFQQGNASDCTQLGPINTSWRIILSLKFRGPTWEMWCYCLRVWGSMT